jgi:hypothetical protein
VGWGASTADCAWSLLDGIGRLWRGLFEPKWNGHGTTRSAGNDAPSAPVAAGVSERCGALSLESGGLSRARNRAGWLRASGLSMERGSVRREPQCSTPRRRDPFAGDTEATGPRLRPQTLLWMGIGSDWVTGEGGEPLTDFAFQCRELMTQGVTRRHSVMRAATAAIGSMPFRRCVPNRSAGSTGLMVFVRGSLCQKRAAGAGVPCGDGSYLPRKRRRA